MVRFPLDPEEFARDINKAPVEIGTQVTFRILFILIQCRQSLLVVSRQVIVDLVGVAAAGLGSAACSRFIGPTASPASCSRAHAIARSRTTRTPWPLSEVMPKRSTAFMTSRGSR